MMWLKSIKVLSWIASVALVCAALFLAYIVLFPVDVIKNWDLNLPEKNEYHLGEVVVLESIYTKTVSTTNSSQSERYLECKNERGVTLRYLLNKAVANRKPATSTGTGVVVEIPDELSGLTLPTTCFFSVSISYDVYPRRAEPEYNRTRDFTLLPVTQPTSSADQQATALTAPLAQSEFRASKLPEGSDVEVPDSEAASAETSREPVSEPVQQPGFVQQLLNAVRGLL